MTSYLTFQEEVTRMRADAFLLEKDIVFMVEGNDDVAFWAFVLNRLLPNKYQILKESRLPVEGSSGKQTLQHYLPFVQKDFCLCIDSDYDYLLQHSDWQRLFVFQTYVHSIESYFCFAPRLKNVLKRALNLKNTEGVLNSHCIDFLARYSTIVFDYFIELLWQLNQKSLDNQLIRSNFEKDIRLPQHFKDKSPDTVLIDLEARLKQRKRQISVPNAFKITLNELGLTEQNAYLFIHGKTIRNGVILPLLDYWHKHLQQNKRNEIEAITDLTEKRTAQSFFKHIKKVADCFEEEMDFINCPLFEKIEKDIKAALDI
jgi:hypothetical protein